MNLDQHFTENSILTYTGKPFDLKILDPETICIEDIAHSLSLTARFGGHLEGLYSVAQHSCYVANSVAPQDKLAALLHDASEAYMGDMPGPFKKMMPEYRRLEDNLMKVIAKKFGFQYPLDPSIKECDDDFLRLEQTAFIRKTINIPYWEPKYAEEQFLVAFHQYMNYAH